MVGLGIVIFVLGGLVGSLVVMAADVDPIDIRQLLCRKAPLTETETAMAEREAELDRRTAQIIREAGVERYEARHKAETDYLEELKEV